MYMYMYMYLILLFFTSCMNNKEVETPFYVVEAFIYAGEPVQGIRVKELTPLDSGSEAQASIVADAFISLGKGGKTYSLDFDLTSETYYYPGNDLVIEPGDLVELIVDANGRRSSGETLVPESPVGVRSNMTELQVPQLSFSFDLRDQIVALFESARLVVEWDNASEDLHFIAVQNRVEQLEPILPAEVPAEAEELLESFRFISEPTESTTFEVIGVALETYGTHVVKVYRVNQEYADLFRNDTQDSRDLNAPPTNMTGAFGIFSAFSSDSVIFEVVRP